MGLRMTGSWYRREPFLCRGAGDLCCCNGSPNRRAPSPTTQPSSSSHSRRTRPALGGPARPRRLLRRTRRTAEPAQLGALSISELVSNLFQHAHTPTILWAEYEADTLTVAATDGETSLPALLAPDDHREGGRGIALIVQMAISWGLTRTGLGKVVWVTFEAALG